MCEVVIKGEDRWNLEPLHDGEASGVSEGERFIRILVKDRASLLFITDGNAYDDGWTLVQLVEKAQRV